MKVNSYVLLNEPLSGWFSNEAGIKRGLNTDLQICVHPRKMYHFCGFEKSSETLPFPWHVQPIAYVPDIIMIKFNVITTLITVDGLLYNAMPNEQVESRLQTTQSNQFNLHLIEDSLKSK